MKRAYNRFITLFAVAFAVNLLVFAVVLLVFAASAATAQQDIETVTLNAGQNNATCEGVLSLITFDSDNGTALLHCSDPSIYLTPTNTPTPFATATETVTATQTPEPTATIGPTTAPTLEPTATATTPPTVTPMPTSPPINTPTPQPSVTPTEVSGGTFFRTYAINRGSIPEPVRGVTGTVAIELNGASIASVSGGEVVREDGGTAYIATSVNSITVEFSGSGSPVASLAPVYAGHSAAWSHAYDDNKNFEGDMPQYLAYGVGAHVALIAENVRGEHVDGVVRKFDGSSSNYRNWSYDQDDIAAYWPNVSVTFHDKECPPCNGDSNYSQIAAGLLDEYLWLKGIVQDVDPGATVTVMTAPNNNQEFLFVAQQMALLDGVDLIATEGQGQGMIWMNAISSDAEYQLPTDVYPAEGLDIETEVIPRRAVSNAGAASDLIEDINAAIASGEYIWFNTFSHSDTSALNAVQTIQDQSMSVHIAGVDHILAHWLFYTEAVLTEQ